jgi:fucose permease
MMGTARRDEVATVYIAGIFQGLALVTFPAAASVLTDPAEYGLSSSAYGALFVPQAVAAVAGSLAGGGLATRLGLKRVLLIGLSLDLLAMTLLVTSQVGMGGTLGYAMLLLATTSLGAGFGLTVPALNTFAAAFFADRVDRAVLLLNALLGLGTALAPVLAAIFLTLDLWWGLPVCVGLGLFGVIVEGARLPLVGRASREVVEDRPRVWPLPPSARVFIAFALLYGIVETVNGNWATVYMTADVGASASAATLALAAFWGMVTVGRLLFAGLERWVPETRAYGAQPIVAAVALVIIALLPEGGVAGGVLAFGLSGLGCSVLLPLTISFGQATLMALGTTTAAVLFASYQVGYGIAAFGVGPLEDAGVGLNAIYVLAAGIAIVLAVLSRRLVRDRDDALRPHAA